MNFNKLYINGVWEKAKSGAWIEVENPFTQQIITKVPRANAEDVSLAVEAAKKAFKTWQFTSLDTRIEILDKALQLLFKQEEELTQVEVNELGAPLKWSRFVHVMGPLKRFEKYLKLAKEIEWEISLPRSKVVKEPIGVVGCITPWNYPLDQVIQKVIPAMLTGNTVVLKPSQITPLSAFYLAHALEEAGLPQGVFNLVTGVGGEVGNVLAKHPDVDMISFTGSTAGGIEVSQMAMQTVKKVALELGGKSPHILLEADQYQAAVRQTLDSCFYNTGQTCSALTRLIVPKRDLKKIEEEILSQYSNYVVGDPHDEKTNIGPLSSKKQWLKVNQYILQGIEEGAKLLVGKVPVDHSQGYFVEPLVFSEVTPQMTLAREEIFGPVLCVIPYDSLDEAIEIANDSIYGLSAAVSGPVDLANDVAKQIKSGSVYINQGKWDPLAPFGGYKQSGIGREGGMFGLEEFLEIKAVFG